MTYFIQPQVCNPASAEVDSEEVWPEAEADIMRNGMTPQAVVDKAIKRVEAIFAKYPIAQS
jgi:multiple sugar transport system substrate-binding protein